MRRNHLYDAGADDRDAPDAPLTTLQRIQLIRPWVSESSQRELDLIAADVRALQALLDGRLFDVPHPVNPMETQA